MMALVYSPPGLLRSDSIPEAGEDAAATVGMAETLSEEEQDELRKELAKVNLLQTALKLVLRMELWDNAVFKHTVDALCINFVSQAMYGTPARCGEGKWQGENSQF